MTLLSLLSLLSKPNPNEKEGKSRKQKPKRVRGCVLTPFVHPPADFPSALPLFHEKNLPAELGKECLADKPIHGRREVQHLCDRDQTRCQVDQEAEGAELVHQHGQHQVCIGLFLDSDLVVFILEVQHDVARQGRRTKAVTVIGLQLRCLGQLIQNRSRSDQGNRAANGDPCPERRGGRGEGSGDGDRASLEGFA